MLIVTNDLKNKNKTLQFHDKSVYIGEWKKGSREGTGEVSIKKLVLNQRISRTT